MIVVCNDSSLLTICKRKFILLFLLVAGVVCNANAQTATPATYPKITAYVGAVHPIVTFSKNKPVYNFDNAYVGGLITGINLWKNPKIGFSMEFVPFIRAANGTSKMNNFLFHPGVLFALGNSYTLTTRAAFETSGRYGFTPVINKIVKRNKGSSFYIAIPVPVRFGNDLPTTFALGFQLGLAF